MDRHLSNKGWGKTSAFVPAPHDGKIDILFPMACLVSLSFSALYLKATEREMCERARRQLGKSDPSVPRDEISDV